jgi:hypothetical protein
MTGSLLKRRRRVTVVTDVDIPVNFLGTNLSRARQIQFVLRIIALHSLSQNSPNGLGFKNILRSQQSPPTHGRLVLVARHNTWASFARNNEITVVFFETLSG